LEKCDHARHTLSFCVDALNEIKDETPTGATWERRWGSLMALLRTACELLEQEAPIWWDREMKKPNRAARGRDAKKKMKPDIYGKFIQADSNLFLHEGKLTTGQSTTVFLVGVSAQARAAGEPPRPPLDLGPPQPARIFYHMNTGYYANRDPISVAGEAIAWLEQAINEAEG
jgi:hypothetical protein